MSSCSSTSRRRPGSPLLASLLENDDMLSEVLLRLPPAPSSLPHVSLVCKRWRRLVSDHVFLRRFRDHHRRNAPCLGFFTHELSGKPTFNPTMDPPDRLPCERFSLELERGCNIVSCRHGLVLILNRALRYLLVWDPVTGDVIRVAFPPNFGRVGGLFFTHGSVLRAVGNVRDGDQIPFLVALVVNDQGGARAFACLYSSVTGLWGDIISTACACPSEIPIFSPSSLIGSSLYWMLGCSGPVGILEFDLDRQRLAVIDVPPGILAFRLFHHWVMPAEGGGLGFLCLSGYHAELWTRKKGSDGVARWVLGRTVELDKLLSLKQKGGGRPFMFGFAEEDNVSFFATGDGVFMVQLESMQFKKPFEFLVIGNYHSFQVSIHTAGITLYLYNDRYMKHTIASDRDSQCTNELAAWHQVNSLAAVLESLLALTQVRNSSIPQNTTVSDGEGAMTNACIPSSLPASPLENDDLLSVILLGLPPAPSSLPRASLVCKRWHRLTSDPGFRRRFRVRHRRNAPIVGFLKPDPGEISFTPILDPPDRVPSGRFSLHIDGRSRLKIISIRHGLVLIHDLTQLQLLVWDPVTSDVNGVAYPEEFFDEKGISRLKGTALRVAGDVNCGEGSSHFQVVLVGNDEGVTKAIASVYKSETGEWGDLISTPCPMYPSPRSCILIGSSLCWFLIGLSSVGVLEFDLDRQTLALIEIPEEMSDWMGHFMIVHADDGEIGFLFLSSFTLQKWKRQADVDAGWVLGSSVELDKLLNMDGPTDLLIYGYLDDNNVLLVMTGGTFFEIQLDSMQLKKSFEIDTSSVNCGHPYSCVYAAGNVIQLNTLQVY
ncbi:hypothetical protein PR202_ga07070 [Eleusine coracana subsp. coracana]|uniref:F-box domain-containing protein n=1 Tax=Eleusine coracana subsp. coracana TaxID=191504 RepID=A0AAV5BY87_ELECO|nr:hypothetical protein PR202_ga07070 [Eleusine coracana subsp. coracana]